MKPFQIKDNSHEGKEQFNDVHNIVRTVADKTLEQLERDGVFVFPELKTESNDLTREQMILQSINNDYYTGNVMGFLGCGEERLVIRSRFGPEGNDYFFQYLLEKVIEFPNVVNLNTDADNNDRMFTLLLFLFPSYLAAAMRKGPYKSYVRNEYNDENVKGTIDIARHIRKNTPFIGNIAYNQREYSYDNYLMQLIRLTIEYIKSKPNGNSIIARVKDEVGVVIDATPDFELKNANKIITENKKTAVRHAYYHEYRDLQRLCILILQNEKHQAGIGSRKVYGILFDGAWLWEEYVNKLIKDKFYHPMNKAGNGGQWLFAGGAGRIFPDFMSRDAGTRIIADAKYKPLDNIGNRDYLQVLAYMFRFDSKKAFYLYPESGSNESKTLIVNSGSSYEDNVKPRDDVFVIKLGLNIPGDAQNYEEFRTKMIARENDFKNSIYGEEGWQQAI
jgi:5-methylcytosine-specific restriction endonuclease McrBC regulatory subunit McrC